jgi:5'-3' exonuclease
MVENTFIIVDVSNLAYRAGYANKTLSTSEGKFSGHIFGSASSLLALLRNEFSGQNVKFVFCYDGKDAKDYRRSIYPGYKANRMPKDIDPLPEVVNFIQKWPGLHIYQDDMEGDDAIAFAVHMRQGKNCVVLSGDKDLWALMRYPNCKVFSPNLKRYVTAVDVLEEYHIKDRPERIYLAKSLFGDSSDDIKGVERLIKKQVDPVLNQEGVETPEQFYNALGDVRPAFITEKMWAKLLCHKEDVFRNFKIVQPRIEFNKTSVTKTDLDIPKIRKVLGEYECFSLLSQLDVLTLCAS